MSYENLSVILLLECYYDLPPFWMLKRIRVNHNGLSDVPANCLTAWRSLESCLASSGAAEKQGDILIRTSPPENPVFVVQWILWRAGLNILLHLIQFAKVCCYIDMQCFSSLGYQIIS